MLTVRTVSVEVIVFGSDTRRAGFRLVLFPAAGHDHGVLGMATAEIAVDIDGAHLEGVCLTVSTVK